MNRKIILLTVILIMATISMVSAEKEISLYYLGNGLKLIVKQNPYNEIVAIDCFIKVGSYYETAENSGITNFVQKMLLKGTKKRNALEISTALEEVGGFINTSAAEDYAETYTITTNEDTDIAIEVLADVLFRSTFPKDEVKTERNIILNEIKLANDSSFGQCYKLFKKSLYGENNYGLPVQGSPETVSSITRKELKDYYKNYYVPNNMTISIVGNVNPEEIVEKINAEFGKYPEKRINRDEPEVTFIQQEDPAVIEKEIMQSMIVLGYPAMNIDDENYAHMKVINALLGTGMSSRLFVELREKKGLAYAVGSFLPSRKNKSHFVGYIGTKPDSTEDAKNGLIEEIEKIKNADITDEELEKAKNSIIGNYLIDHQQNKRQAWYLGWYEILDVGINFDYLYVQKIRSVTKYDIKRTARLYLNNPTIAIVKPEEEE